MDGIMNDWESQIKYLEISYEELAKLLRIKVRSVYRWRKNPETMTGPTIEALKAWVLLKKNNIHWHDRIITKNIEVRHIND